MKYDVAIIGGGPAGYTAAERAAQGGLSTILFEKNALGGVCLNEGCVPTKTLLYSAKTYDNIKHASKYAVKAENPSFDLPKIIARKNKVVKKLTAGIRMKMTEHGVVMVTAEACIQGRAADGTITIAAGEELYEAANLLIISVKSDVENIKVLFGEQENVDWNKADIDWNAIDSQLISRRIAVTRNRVNGVKLGSLRLRNLYGINITRVNRAGIDLLASPDLRLQIGDRLTIVGEANSVNTVGKILGDEIKRLNNPNLLAVFIGISLGMLLGALPITLPGMSTPVKLGIAGGPIIVGILMGAFGPRFHLTTYTTMSANLMLRQLGIIIYLAGLGIDSGVHFFETVFRAEGLLWIGLGFLLTIVPVLIVGFIASQFFKLDYAHNVGMLCGSMANPMALSYANTTVDGDEPSVSYATVYPLSMFIRVISAQLVLMLFT